MIAAIILAAGQSKRMGQPKMLLPWGKMTVIEHVIEIYAAADIAEILIVTGAAHDQVEEILKHSRQRHRVRIVYNQNYLNGEMLSSLQHGLHALQQTPIYQAALIGPGDQPQVEEESIRSVCEAFTKTGSPLVVPSFQRRRGHPWLVARPLWDELLELRHPKSSRDFLNKHADEIHYVNVETPNVLADLDTPEDYERSRP
jgi:molybdenum cofactor cytidylyltransferase